MNDKPGFFTVILKMCTCKLRDLTGIPCSHVISAAKWLKHEAEEYVHHFLKKGTYLASYGVAIMPCVSEKF